MAQALDLYVNGSLNVFNHRTNVNIENRIVAFDISEPFSFYNINRQTRDQQGG